ncbi:MAG: sigma 54-interacting transcriptional regulator [Candidatus Zixiibacteriota bacterium]
MEDVVDRIVKYLKYNISPVLIIGESGSGKEYIAKLLLSENEDYANARIISENCAISKGNPELLESKLFGHVRGAFTGADSGRKGLLRSASRGIFLDEIDKSPIELQNYLLRYLREGEIRPVGSDRIEYDATKKKLIFASSDTNLKSLLFNQLSGDYRQGKHQDNTYSLDFLNRIKRNVIVMPPLRDRLKDLGLITDYLIKQQIKDTVIKITHISGHTIQFILNHGWFGNIAELSDFIANGILAPERHGGHLVLHMDACMNYYLDHQPEASNDWLNNGQIKGDIVDKYLLICNKINSGEWVKDFDDLVTYSSGDIPIKNLPKVFANALYLFNLQCDLKASDDGAAKIEEIINYFELKKALKTKKAVCERLNWTGTRLRKWLTANHLDY